MPEAMTSAVPTIIGSVRHLAPDEVADDDRPEDDDVAERRDDGDVAVAHEVDGDQVAADQEHRRAADEQQRVVRSGIAQVSPAARP